MVFGVGQFNCASRIWLGQTIVAMATKIYDFQQKIGYNSFCRRYAPDSCTYYGVFGIGQFNVVSQTLLRRPLLPW